jgi:hypothetical protein
MAPWKNRRVVLELTEDVSWSRKLAMPVDSLETPRAWLGGHRSRLSAKARSSTSPPRLCRGGCSSERRMRAQMKKRASAAET